MVVCGGSDSELLPPETRRDQTSSHVILLVHTFNNFFVVMVTRGKVIIVESLY